MMKNLQGMRQRSSSGILRPSGCFGVGDRLRANRWWLALAYALVTVLAQGVHEHGAEADDAAASAGADCREPRSHVERADPSARPHGPEHCPACQYRANPHEAPAASGLLPLAHVDLARTASHPSPGLPSLLRPSCRAPPRG
jgi:hypothetical protein